VTIVADDLHSPTTAGPTPEPATEAGRAAAELGEGAAHSDGGHPSSPAAPASPLERPEVQAGAAFAGGLLAAMILKRLGRN
jgi:hypothetical protein